MFLSNSCMILSVIDISYLQIWKSDVWIWLTSLIVLDDKNLWKSVLLLCMFIYTSSSVFFLEYVRSVSWINVDESGLFLFKTLDFPSSFFLHLASVFFYLILPCFTHMRYPMFSFTDEQKVDVKNS